MAVIEFICRDCLACVDIQKRFYRILSKCPSCRGGRLVEMSSPDRVVRLTDLFESVQSLVERVKHLVERIEKAEKDIEAEESSSDAVVVELEAPECECECHTEDDNSKIVH